MHFLLQFWFKTLDVNAADFVRWHENDFAISESRKYFSSNSLKWTIVLNDKLCSTRNAHILISAVLTSSSFMDDFLKMFVSIIKKNRVYLDVCK